MNIRYEVQAQQEDLSWELVQATERESDAIRLCNELGDGNPYTTYRAVALITVELEVCEGARGHH
jgi:hypothetical protein